MCQYSYVRIRWTGTGREGMLIRIGNLSLQLPHVHPLSRANFITGAAATGATTCCKIRTMTRDDDGSVVNGCGAKQRKTCGSRRRCMSCVSCSIIIIIKRRREGLIWILRYHQTDDAEDLLNEKSAKFYFLHSICVAPLSRSSSGGGIEVGLVARKKRLNYSRAKTNQ